MRIFTVLFVLVACAGWATPEQPPARPAQSADAALGVASGQQEVVAGNELAARYYVEYTWYRKKNGIVKKLGSGRAGPYDTRAEAQSRADSYNANDYTSGGVRYWYSARVR